MSVSHRGKSENVPAKITVITVCLNAAQTIGAAIRSVLSQTYPELEYIVVDGGSTDGTMDIVSRYSGSITKVISEPDKGIYDAINKGITISTGDVIGILNADDLYAPWTFSAVRSAVANNSGCGVYAGHTIYLDGHAGRWRAVYLDKRWFDEPKLPVTFCHQSTFVTKETYALHGFYSTEYKFASDWDYFLKLHEAGVKFGIIDAVLAAFYLGGTSALNFPEVLEEVMHVADRRKIGTADKQKYYAAAKRSYSRVKWIKRLGLSRVAFRLRELAGTFRPSGEWEASMEQEVFADYLQKTGVQTANSFHQARSQALRRYEHKP